MQFVDGANWPRRGTVAAVQVPQPPLWGGAVPKPSNPSHSPPGVTSHPVGDPNFSFDGFREFHATKNGTGIFYCR